MSARVFIGALSLFISVSTYADYEFEVNLGFNFGSEDSNNFYVYSLGASLYFDEVDDSKGPLREAEFLDQASGISFSFDTSKIESFGSTDTSELSIRLVGEAGWIFQASYTDLESDENLSVGIGKYLTDTSELITSFTTSNDAGFDSLGFVYHALSESI